MSRVEPMPVASTAEPGRFASNPSARRVLAALLVLAALSSPVSAQSTATVTYRAGKKDSLELISAEYYGERSYGVFIVTENKLKKGLQPYQRLRIPVTKEITTQKGDTFASLAEKFLGDPKREQFLADFNKLPVDESLATGTSLTIPFHVTYVSENGESVAAVAARFYGDGKQAELLKRYNFLEKGTLDKGEVIEVPVLFVRVRPSKLPQLDTESQDRQRQRVKITDMAATALPTARAAYAQGDFAHVLDVLTPFADQLEYLDSSTAVAIGLLLGKAHIAFDNTDAAVTAFVQVHERKGSFKVHAYDASPKVLDAWKKAGGDVVQ